MNRILPNRLAVYLTAAAALCAALAPIVADLDWESTAGVIGGLAAIAFVVRQWLDGWSKWERGEGQITPFPPLDEEPFDEDVATIPPSVEEAARAQPTQVDPTARRTP